LKQPPEITKAMINSTLPKSRGQTIIEYILLGVCLCVLALRATLTESLTVQSTTMPANLADNIYTLSVSAVLIFSFILWLVWSFCSGRFAYRFTGMEIGLFLFCTAAVIAGFVASNKRLAITNFVTLLAPIFMAVLLVQILDSHSKIKLLLCVIAALAVVSAYQSAEQLFFSNQMTIDQYEQAPQSILEPLGIQPGTFAKFLFEHRLYTKGIRGFFTTSNSAGSFALLATFAAVALLIEKLKVLSSYNNSKLKTQNSKLHIALCGIAVAAVIFALVITRSKGVIISSLFVAALFILLLRFGDRVKAHKQIIIIACFLLFTAAVFIVARYGLTHGRLPGGNSMLVRWQYWHASAKMFADHPLTGVGPGNFTNFYPRYKPAEALESVSDPHSFPLSILTQYGPLGLIGFLAMLFIPLWKTIPSSSIDNRESPQDALRQKVQQPSFKTVAITYLILVSAAMLLIRPMIMRTPLGDAFEVALYLILTLYVAPVAAFFIGFWLLIIEPKTQAAGPEPQTTYIPAALFCAVLGVMLHNLIDFAIFEPPVLTVFWAVTAALIATHINQTHHVRDASRQEQQPFIIRTTPFAKVIVLIIAAAISWAYLNYCLIPPAANTTKILQAYRNASDGFFEQAHNLLAIAADDDKLDPTAPNLNGQLYLQNYHGTGEKHSYLLKKAELCFLEAIARDHANYKNYEKLCTVYDLLDRPQNAYEFGSYAAERYPGSATIQFDLAQIAEKLHKTDAAITHYKNTIDIEDSFRRQFEIMYPDREIVSRLGQDKYNSAKDRLNFLSEQPTP
jgi:hypothetical protein